MSNIKVVHAQLHDVIFIPGEGNLDKSLPPQTKTLKDFRMSRDPNGDLLLEWTHGVKNKRFVVPQATVKGLLLEDTEIKATK